MKWKVSDAETTALFGPSLQTKYKKQNLVMIADPETRGYIILGRLTRKEYARGRHKSQCYEQLKRKL